jgi:DNA-binding transcriptional MerR regulator
MGAVDKAPDAFRTISEVAQDLDVPQHVLRFWESRFREIKPMKRGGGRRYYRPDDVGLLRGIRHLLYGEGYTIRGVQRILREQGIKFVQAVWQPGAPQPSHGPSEDNEFPPEEPAVRDPIPAEAERRGLFGLLPGLLGEGHDEPADRPAPPALPALPPQVPHPPSVTGGAATAAEPLSTLSPEDARRLRHALHELGECRKLIDAAFNAPA